MLVRVPAPLLRALRAEARQAGVKLSPYVRELLETHSRRGGRK